MIDLLLLFIAIFGSFFLFSVPIISFVIITSIIYYMKRLANPSPNWLVIILWVLIFIYIAYNM